MGEAGGFGLYVSCVDGKPVARFGTKILIGADRDAVERKKIRYRSKEIVAIPEGEARRYAREYARAIQEGELVARTADEWQAQQKQLEEVGAPRSKLKTAVDPPAPAEEDTPDADHESSRELG